jgi:hypothetical protein
MEIASHGLHVPLEGLQGWASGAATPASRASAILRRPTQRFNPCFERSHLGRHVVAHLGAAGEAPRAHDDGRPATRASQRDDATLSGAPATYLLASAPRLGRPEMAYGSATSPSATCVGLSQKALRSASRGADDMDRNPFTVNARCGEPQWPRHETAQTPSPSRPASQHELGLTSWVASCGKPLGTLLALRALGRLEAVRSLRP